MITPEAGSFRLRAWGSGGDWEELFPDEITAESAAATYACQVRRAALLRWYEAVHTDLERIRDALQALDVTETSTPEQNNHYTACVQQAEESHDEHR